MRGWAGALRAAVTGPGPVRGGFRERFDFGGRDVVSWFPGHMAKGLRQMRASLRRADCLIEVHDARISSGTTLHPSRGSRSRDSVPCTGVVPTLRPRVPQSTSRPPPCPAPVPFVPLPCPLSPSRAPCPPPVPLSSSALAPSTLFPALPPSPSLQYLFPHQCTVTLLSGTHIPLSGRNPMLQEALGIRPHILVLNKMDLADPHRQPAILEQLKQQGRSHVVFTDCQHDGNVKKIIPLVAKLVSNSPRYHRAENTEYNILVIGVPNVGKSSLINALRRLHLKKGKATAVGGEPGITKAVLTRIQVSEKPLMYLVDTPGLLPPRLGDVEMGMKLALCGAIRDHLVGEDIMADYLLYTLNKWQQFGYTQRYGLAAPCDDIEPVLKQVALTLGRTQKVKVLTGTGNVNVTMLNYPAAACEFLRDFRAGRLGRVTLD